MSPPASSIVNRTDRRLETLEALRDQVHATCMTTGIDPKVKQELLQAAKAVAISAFVLEDNNTERAKDLARDARSVIQIPGVIIATEQEGALAIEIIILAAGILKPSGGQVDEVEVEFMDMSDPLWD